MGAGQEPTFAYDAALAAARELWALAEVLEHRARERRVTRDRCLDTWRGALGTEMRSRAEAEDQSAVSVAGALRSMAEQWATLWQQAADERNRVHWARAVERQRAWEEEQRNLLEDAFALLFGSSEGFDTERPRAAARPSAPGFGAGRPAFVRYRREGDVMVPFYSHRP